MRLTNRTSWNGLAATLLLLLLGACAHLAPSNSSSRVAARPFQLVRFVRRMRPGLRSLPAPSV